MRGKIYSGRAVFPRRQPTRTLYASRIVFAIMSRNIVTASCPPIPAMTRFMALRLLS